MKKLDQYYSFLTNKIVLENKLGIKEIKTIASKGDYLFSLEVFEKIRVAITSGASLPKNNGSLSTPSREYLGVFEIADQVGRTFCVLVYDNDELWQDPTIMEIIKLD